MPDVVVVEETTVQVVETPGEDTVVLLNDERIVVSETGRTGPQGPARPWIVAMLITQPNSSMPIVVDGGNGETFWRVPAMLDGWTINTVSAALGTVSSSGPVAVQLRKRKLSSGLYVDMLTTVVTIEQNEVDSSQAAVQPVINAAEQVVATGDQIWYKKTLSGTGAKGLYVEFTLTQ